MKKKYEQQTNDVRLTEEVYWKLVEMKFNTRQRSIDEVLRVLLGLPPNHPRVRTYSHENNLYQHTVSNDGNKPELICPPITDTISERDAWILNGGKKPGQIQA